MSPPIAPVPSSGHMLPLETKDPKLAKARAPMRQIDLACSSLSANGYGYVHVSGRDRANVPLACSAGRFAARDGSVYALDPTFARPPSRLERAAPLH